MFSSDQHKEITYAEVEVALYDPNVRMRSLMRSILLTIGFRSINEARNAREIVATIRLQPTDLLIIDLDHEPDNICAFIRDIREGVFGTNPFIVIIGMTGNPEKAMISRLLQTGLDDLIAKPISPNILSERTMNLIRNRKKFLVTTSYIGPDRRGEKQRFEGDLESILVPNSLRYKTTGDKEAIADTVALDTIERLVNMHRIFRFAREICEECERLEGEFAVNEIGKIPSWNYRDMAEKTDAINEKITFGNVEVLVPISESMRLVVKSIYALEQPTARHFSILRLHGEAIGEAIKDERAAAQLIAEALVQTVGIKGSTKLNPARQSAA
ncbi:MAG: response regulator [Alphaproteobacteria bacterium]|nr:response regulator [Alphaproteobacteria bacterium]